MFFLLCDPKLSTVLKDNRTERKEAVLEPRVDPGDPGGVALTIENLQRGKWNMEEIENNQTSRLT